MGDSDVVIRVEGLGKKYALHHEKSERYTALRDVVARQARAAGRLLNPFTLAGQLRKAQRAAAAERAESEEEFWALKDVSFEICRGERVGIIGRNGAGKSTLLKILSRITEPTTGRVEIRGRVASLLEVGTGFHPELTGRENIYLNGAILGMTRREIRRKFDEIVDFAEVEKFLDTPVKRYSSGMYVRLAFAVAAHLEPEILVVDEVLAVGDASFQKKCLGKMEDVADREGRTVLLVSHNIQALKALCNRGVLLEEGRVKHSENIDAAIGAYQSGFKHGERRHSRDWRQEAVRPGDSGLRLLYLDVTSNGDTGPLQDDLPVTINALVECGNSAEKKSIGFVISSLTGETVIHVDHLAARGASKSLGRGINHLTLEFPAGILKPGLYSVRICGTEPMVSFHFDVENVLLLEVATRNSELLRQGIAAWKAPSSPAICKATAVQIGPSQCFANF